MRRWVEQAAVDAGERDRLTAEEREELRRLQRENRVLREERDILNSQRFPRDGDPMNRYRFVESESGRYPVTQLCRIAQVSRAAYYDWKDGSPSARAQADVALTAKIRAIHAASDGQYGVPRVLEELRAQGEHVSKKRVARLMKAAGLRGRRPPRWVRTTTPEPTPPAIPDLVHGDFTAPAPDVLWVGDITYIRTWEGWLYLATVLDVFSRRVIAGIGVDCTGPGSLDSVLS